MLLYIQQKAPRSTLFCIYLLLLLSEFLQSIFDPPTLCALTLPIFLGVDTQTNRMLQNWFIAHSTIVPLKRRETTLQEAKANIKLHKHLFKRRKCYQNLATQTEYTVHGQQ